jgi:IS4 transposase
MLSMLLDPLFDRFLETTPLTVMTRGLIENTLKPSILDELFDRLAERQYVRESLFSDIVQAMLLIACRIYKSPRAVFRNHRKHFPATLKSFYEKLKGIELPLMREFVRDNARRLKPIIDQLLGGRVPDLLPGYRIRILDGNALGGTHHRIKELRGLSSAALPGKSLVVLDPAYGLIVDLFPCEDGHTQERALLPEVLATVGAGELWIEDRNFCTLGFIRGVADCDAFILVREHKGLPWLPLSELRTIGRTETGTVHEQQVSIEDEEGKPRKLRRIVIKLSEPTRDGEREVALLTNLSAGICAVKLAELYLKRWTIENAFNVLTVALKCEGKSLGYPKAALFAFCVTVVAYNVLATVKAALRSVHGVDKVEKEVSLPLVAEQVETDYGGMMKGLPAQAWQRFCDMTATQMAEFLHHAARLVDLEVIRKAPTKPKKIKIKPAYDPSKPHVSTARLLAARRAQ